jgi:hypothetical protein
MKRIVTKIFNVVNKLMLTDVTRKLTPEDIDRTQRVGHPKRGAITTKCPRDIIVKVVSYRERTRVFARKRNQKSIMLTKTMNTGSL